MSSYADGYLQACHDIKVMANGQFAVKSVIGMAISRSTLNSYIDHFAKIESRNDRSRNE